MKIIIAGCGKIGMALVENLVNEGHEVVALDSNPRRYHRYYQCI